MQEIKIDLHPSKLFISLILIAVICSMIIILRLQILFSFKFFLIMMTYYYGAYIFLRHGVLKHSRSIFSLCLKKEDCQLADQIGVVSATLCGDSTLTNFLCVLRFRVPGKFFKRNCVIFRDSIGHDVYRKLICFVRCGGGV